MALRRSIIRGIEFQEIGSKQLFLQFYIGKTQNFLAASQCCKFTTFNSSMPTGKKLWSYGKNRILFPKIEHCHFSQTTAMEPELKTEAAKEVNSLDANEKVESEVYDKLYKSIEVECRGGDIAVLHSYEKFISWSANHLDIDIAEVSFPRHHKRRLTLLKSVFVHKKHRVQYEIRTHFLIVKMVKLTSSTADTFLEYIQRNLPEGVSMKVTKNEITRLPPHVKPSALVAPHEDS